MKEIFSYRERGTMGSGRNTRRLASSNAAMQGRSSAVVNVTENPIEDIIADFVSIFYRFCARLYGQRRAKRKTEKIVQDLNVQTE